MLYAPTFARAFANLARPQARALIRAGRWASILSVICASILANAYAQIHISPLRHVLSPQSERAAFVLSNPSAQPISATLSWEDLAIIDGEYAQMPNAQRAKISAAPYLTIRPAQIRLAPGEAQHIELTLSRKPDFSGERRSHLLVETTAQRALINKIDHAGLGVDIGLSFSLPVFVRTHQKSAAKINATALTRDRNGNLLLETQLESTGDISAFGELAVKFTPADTKTTRILARQHNAAALAHSPGRRYRLPLNMVSLPKGVLELVYLGAEEFSGQEFDRREFLIEAPKD